MDRYPNKISASEAARRFAAPGDFLEVTYALQNMVDSHDTDRLVSKCHNRSCVRQRQQRTRRPDVRRPKPPARAINKQTGDFLQHSPGAYMIYYGDEVGLWGSDDPNPQTDALERPRAYEESGMAVMDDHLAFYQRPCPSKQFTALHTESIETILTDDEQDVMAFVREDDANRLLVILNANDIRPRSRCPSMANGVSLRLAAASQDCVLLESGAVYLHSKP